MSAELLETIKEQTEALTPQERSELARHLLEQANELPRTAAASTNDADDEIRQRRLEWLKAHREEYAGQYVAMDGALLVGHGATIGEAHRQAKLKGIRSPFLARVTSENEVLFAGW
jgi:broad specificity phosphatase PhoE